MANGTEGIAMRDYFLVLGALVVVCTGCASFDTGSSILSNREHVAPPAAVQSRPGPMVDGPGPGVLGMLGQPGMGMAAPPMSTQIKFVGPETMTIGWRAGATFASSQVQSGQYYDFYQSAVYQLMLEGLELPGVDPRPLYPTLEVRAAHPNTLAYLQHNAVPVEITEEDLEHVNSSNMVTKVIYLPAPEFQARAIAGVETLVSTRLDPGIDPVQQAEQMGTVMLILRFGNKDLQPPASMMNADGSVTQVNYMMMNGQAGQMAPPTPISTLATDAGGGVPSAMIAAGGGFPGQPPMPVAGMGSMPPWGMPMTSTPIGLPGPPHLPLGGPAGLKSHTVRNLSQNKMPKPVDHLLIDVKHDPGYSVPEPVRHIQYTEKHPVHRPGEVAHPVSKASQFYGF
ncbi:MAG TPA: hypothetical protein EYG03_21855 [Planctomycetes bacterium]|nr:hypothetical protein [Fuerstiella sp.]HIK94598.1 hypothetical protein [Planctomycetota bacterium]